MIKFVLTVKRANLLVSHVGMLAMHFNVKPHEICRRVNSEPCLNKKPMNEIDMMTVYLQQINNVFRYRVVPPAFSILLKQFLKLDKLAKKQNDCIDKVIDDRLFEKLVKIKFPYMIQCHSLSNAKIHFEKEIKKYGLILQKNIV